MKPPNLKFSTTVSSEKPLLPSSTCAIPFSTIFDGFKFVMSSPSTDILPLVISPFCISSRPVIDLITVVFPEPLLPRRETIFPFGISKEIPLKTKITS